MSAHDTQIGDQDVIVPQWTGYPLTLQVNDNANMPQTANGSMVLAYQNLTTQNNEGTLSLSTGGEQPVPYPVAAGAQRPSILTRNWQAENLSITNTSKNQDTPIMIEAIGPGLPGVYPGTLPNDGTSVPLGTYSAAQGDTLPRYMQLLMTADSGDLTIVAVIGGPTDSTGNNAYVFALNAQQNAEPGKAPDGYYAMTRQNTYTFPFNWQGATIFVANLSPETAANVTVILRAL